MPAEKQNEKTYPSGMFIRKGEAKLWVKHVANMKFLESLQ